jgi:subtilase family serine protease
MTQPIASVVLTGGLAGCEARRVTAAVSWPDLTVGVHPFWVRIDSGDAIPESDETDNVASSSVSVSPSYHIVIPLISGS